jgi:hypothetical protein
MNESDEHKIDSSGASILEGTLRLSDRIPWVVTVEVEWLQKGILIVPPGLSEYMAGTNTVHILYDLIDEVLPYEEDSRVIEGVNDFYTAKAITAGGKVCLQLRGLEPTRLLVCPAW